MPPPLHLVVVGGNGFIGSAVCRRALAKGFRVTSISSSGRPYRTPKGHTPAWTAQVDWRTGDALDPASYAETLDGTSAVVHTLGTLLEDTEYKRALREGDALGLLRAAFGNVNGRNPLAPKGTTTYERMNRDAALRVCEAFRDSPPPPAESKAATRPFVFISAADVFRPWIDARYIETKRAAERGITEILAPHAERFRGAWSTTPTHAPSLPPAAAFLDLTSTLHVSLPASLRSSLRAVVADLPGRVNEHIPSPAASLATALSTPPMHVDHVAAAAVQACLDPTIQGVLEKEEQGAAMQSV
ncbi:adenylate kinase [Mycena sanguinolenta]|uniref:Adenylate kinase n=1 Tax=Mycena sanguinolenta TaxID=230812 RepID=A0A8H6YLV9_9AGAR|nr:adenylate kinase [Mycena sanguinolenta]